MIPQAFWTFATAFLRNGIIDTLLLSCVVFRGRCYLIFLLHLLPAKILWIVDVNFRLCGLHPDFQLKCHIQFSQGKAILGWEHCLRFKSMGPSFTLNLIDHIIVALHGSEQFFWTPFYLARILPLKKCKNESQIWPSALRVILPFFAWIKRVFQMKRKIWKGSFTNDFKLGIFWGVLQRKT